MNIKELKEKIMHLDENMRVGGTGHFGEFLECWEAKPTKLLGEDEVIFCISIESAGDEPD